MVREAKPNELSALLELYLDLHEDSIPEMTEHLKNTWNTIMNDENHHIIVNGVCQVKCVSSFLPLVS